VFRYAKLVVILAAATAAGYSTYGAVFSGTWPGTLRTYGPQYHLTVIRQGKALPALTGVNIGQSNATPMSSDLVRLTPEQGGPAHTVKMLLEADLKVGDSLNVFSKRGIVTPVNEVGGKSYWHGLSIAAGCLAGLIAAVLAYLAIVFIGDWFSLQRRPAYG
jgi:hypothetical protein